MTLYGLYECTCTYHMWLYKSKTHISKLSGKSAFPFLKVVQQLWTILKVTETAQDGIHTQNDVINVHTVHTVHNSNTRSTFSDTLTYMIVTYVSAILCTRFYLPNTRLTPFVILQTAKDDQQTQSLVCILHQVLGPCTMKWETNTKITTTLAWTKVELCTYLILH